jgi:recombination protein RecA
MDKQKKLAEARGVLEKKYGKGSTILGNEILEVERLSTGSLGLDIATGGGWGKGRIVEIYGAESSGKTTVCIHTMIEAQKKGGLVAFIDAEHAFDKQYAKNLGLNVDELLISQPDCGEDALSIAEELIKSGAIDVCVIDSVAALVPKSELEGDMGDSKMGLHARLMSQAMRKLTGIVASTNTLLIFTNQMREKIGVMFGNPTTTTGGNALKYYASVRVETSKSQGNKDKEGNLLDSKGKAKVVKNKIAAPFMQCEYDIVFGKGIDKNSEILQYAEELGFIQKSGSWFSVDGNKIGQGAAQVKQFLTDNPEFANELENKIKNNFGI